MISLQSLAKAALSFGVYLVVTVIDVVDITLAFSYKKATFWTHYYADLRKGVNVPACFFR